MRSNLLGIVESFQNADYKRINDELRLLNKEFQGLKTGKGRLEKLEQDLKTLLAEYPAYEPGQPDRDKHVNNVILAQACRHVIVHSGAKVDAKLLKQIADAKPRDLKIALSEGAKIQFEPEEIRLVGHSMLVYVNSLCAGLIKNWGQS